MDQQKLRREVNAKAGEEALSRQERRADDRRKKECKGHMYISMVGWMDRRENGRRLGDDDMLFR